MKTPRSSVRPIEYGEEKLFKAKVHPKGHFLMVAQLMVAIFLMFMIISTEFGLPAYLKVIFSLILFFNVESWKTILDFRGGSLFTFYLSSGLVCMALLIGGSLPNLLSIKVVNLILIGYGLSLSHFVYGHHLKREATQTS